MCDKTAVPCLASILIILEAAYMALVIQRDIVRVEMDNVSPAQNVLKGLNDPKMSFVMLF